MICQYPNLQIGKIELLGYHTLGVSKYEQLGLPYTLRETKALSADRLAELQLEIERLTSLK